MRMRQSGGGSVHVLRAKRTDRDEGLSAITGFDSLSLNFNC